jgi:hypothetical protein
VFAPESQVKVVTPEAVNVDEPPEQIEGLFAAMVIDNELLTATLTVPLFEQPAEVPVTV